MGDALTRNVHGPAHTCVFRHGERTRTHAHMEAWMSMRHHASTRKHGRARTHSHASAQARKHTHTHTRMHTQRHTHTHAHACTHTHAHTNAHTHTHAHTRRQMWHTFAACSHECTCLLCMRDETGHTHSAHPTPYFYVPVSAKKGSHRHHIARVVATLPPSLQCWRCEERGVVLPAKKDSLSARAHLHSRRINIEDMGEGWGSTV